MPKIERGTMHWGRKSDKELAEINALRQSLELPPIKQGMLRCNCGRQFYSADWDRVRYCPYCKVNGSGSEVEN